MKKIYSFFALSALLLSTITCLSQVPQFSHIVIVVGENTASTAVFGCDKAKELVNFAPCTASALI